MVWLFQCRTCRNKPPNKLPSRIVRQDSRRHVSPERYGSSSTISSQDSLFSEDSYLSTEYTKLSDIETSNAGCRQADFLRGQDDWKIVIKPCRRLLPYCFVYLVLLVVLAVADLCVPSLVAPKLMHGLHIDVHGSTLTMTSGGPRVSGTTVSASVNKSVLQFLPNFITWTAHIEPFKAHLNLREEVTGRLLDLGEISIKRSIAIDSQHDFNDTLSGNDLGEFKLTGGIEEVSLAAKQFVVQKTVRSSTVVNCQIYALVWGFLPLYFPYVHAVYDMPFPAFNKFQDKPMVLEDIVQAEGYPGELQAIATAELYNPTPVSFAMQDPLNLRIDYTMKGTDHTIGYLQIPKITVSSGRSLVSARMDILQTGDDYDAIDKMLSDVISVEDGVDPTLNVKVLHAGDYTSHSELVRKTAQQIAMPVGIKKTHSQFLLGVTSDITFLGSLVTRRFSEMSPYKVEVNLNIKNILPQSIRVNKMHLEAYEEDLNGHLTYNVTRTLDPKKYTIPAKAESHWVSFPIHLSEAHLKLSVSEVYYMSESATKRVMTQGVRGVFDIEIGSGDDAPGFKQQVHYVHNKVTGVACYHVAVPRQVCGTHHGFPFWRDKTETL